MPVFLASKPAAETASFEKELNKLPVSATAVTRVDDYYFPAGAPCFTPS
jgi:hypothetical protein